MRIEQTENNVGAIQGEYFTMHIKNKTIYGVILAGGLAALSSTSAAAAEKLTYYCSAQEDWCQLMARTFEAETGIKVAMTRKSSGETYAQIKAESSNPKGDVWWGGTGDPHLQAAEEGLTEAYKSSMRGELQDWALRHSDTSNGRSIGIYSGALGYGYNTELLAKANLPEPKCWKDLTDPVYKGHVQMANPNSSGTAYTTLATIVQIFGEDEGFEFMKKLHKNINQYTKSGSAPIKAAARGENTIGIVFLHDAVKQAVSGFPIKVVAPCEGTGYEIGGMSLIKGAQVLRLRAARRHPITFAGSQSVPGDVEQVGEIVAQSAGLFQNEAHRLQLQEIRQLR
jgi:iron(III) transport system substrate-binding protein